MVAAIVIRLRGSVNVKCRTASSVTPSGVSRSRKSATCEASLGRARRSRTRVPSSSSWVEASRAAAVELRGTETTLGLPAAQPADRAQALLQLRFLTVICQLEEAHPLGLGRHQLLRRHALGPVVRVVVALAAAELAGRGIGGALERRRRQHRPVLAHPLL